MYVCVNSEFGDGQYETVDQFIDMCVKCFGEAPEIRELGGGHIYEIVNKYGQESFVKILEFVE